MPPETKQLEIPTQDPPPEGETPPENMESGETVEQMFKKASEHLEYAPETTPEPPKSPEETAETELAEGTDKKPPKKTKKPKAETKPPPKVEPEPPAEPVKSKRDLFKEKADAEGAYRAKEAKLKEREAAAQALEDRHRDFLADPTAYLEKMNPRAYEEWTARNLQAGSTPEKSETAALKAEVVRLAKLIETNQDTSVKRDELAGYNNSLNDGERILSGPEFDQVRESAALYEEFTGQPSDFRRALAGVWIEYNQNYQKELTPAECCEILLEDAQAHLERVSKSQASHGKPKPPADPTKKKPPPTGKTLTNAQETASAPAEETDFSQFKTKDDLLSAVSQTLEYEPEPEE